tara:strand:- start:214 stop:417 length:204 start_codon:yes stop_codon:yes gene_type:complete
MKKIKFLPILLMFAFINTHSIADTKTDCSQIKTDTAVKMYEKWKCKKGNPDGEGLGKKIKNLFKKKN